MKYIKMNSLTWWASFAPLVAGVFIAATPLHGLVDEASVLQTIFNEASPATLINIGLAGIGLRGAMG